MSTIANVVALAVLFSTSIFAQALGSLSGTVVDPSGAAIPGAKVQLFLSGGKSAIASTQTGPAGEFHIASLRPTTYDLHVDSAGFASATLANIGVDPARDTSLATIKLELSTTTQAVEVKEAAQSVQTTNAEITTTVTTAQVDNLPVLDRQVSNLFMTQAGVALGRAGTTDINGLPPSMTNLTLDGVNIQDNFIRTNGLDYLPNKLTIDQVSELTVNTSNANPSLGLGASQISIVTKSGTNEFHGDAYWYNRNSALEANQWFNNQTGVAKPFLNLNQAGGSIGGPILKDKLFFYLNYEAYRLRTQQLTLNQVLTPSARQGILTYPGPNGGLQTFNVLQAEGLSIDPAIQNLLNSVPSTINSNAVGDGLNTGGYAFNAAANENRDAITGRLDYYLSEKHILAGSYIFNRDFVDRPDIGNFYTVTPPVTNDNNAKFLSLSWRWTPTSRFTNEVRGGFNLAPGNFNVSGKPPAYFLDNGPFAAFGLLDPLLYTNPVNEFLPQGRATNTYALQDNATYTRGKHVVSFGFQAQWIGITPYDYGSTVPYYGLGISSNSTYGFATGAIPGANATFTETGNDLLADLAGLVANDQQLFNATSRTSGFVPGAPNERHYTYNTYSGYVSDSWKILRSLSLTLGLRYDYYTVLHETDSLDLLPELINNNVITTMLSNATTTFAGGPVGPQFYNPDHHNFAPNAGFAWDVFGNGKTAVRGGYSIAYVNDDIIATLVNNIDSTNAGLSSTVSGSGFTNIVSKGLPSIATPAFQVPITFAQNYAVNPTTNAQGMPNPNLTTPYVQQWNFGVQQQVKGGFIVEGRYLGNHLVDGLRAIDYNQINIQAAGFLQDFIRARNNGFLSAAAGQGFNPAYTGPGTQPLTVFPQLPYGGLLTNPTVDYEIQTGQVGELAAIYQQYGLNGNINFFPNPNTNGANVVTNYASSTYNAVQLEVRKRTASGAQFQFNYTYSKALGNTEGEEGAERFEPFLDLHNGAIEKGPLPFDLRHVFHANFYYPIPMGTGHRFAYAPLNRLMDGWGVSSIITYQSGGDFSILSALATLNRAGPYRSGLNTVNTPLNKSQLNNDVGFFMTGNGPMFINPAVINPEGLGTSPPGVAPFQGQIFFNPDPGTLGTLQRDMFNGPWDFNWDCSIQKTTKITERHSVEFRADFFDLTNHTAFTAGDEFGQGTPNNFDVNSTNFGKMGGVANYAFFNPSRVIQFGLYYRF